MTQLRSPTLATLSKQLVVASLVAVGSVPMLQAADGTTPPPPPPSVEDRFKALDQEIQDLRRQLAGSQPVASGPSQEGHVRASSQSGFIIESNDGSSFLKLGGYADVDGRFFANDQRTQNLFDSTTSTAGANTFLVRHARPEVIGQVDNIFEFRFLLELAPTQSNVTATSGESQAPVLLDAFVVTHLYPELNVLIGQSKTPFGLEYLQYTPNIAFAELGLVSQLVPGRDVGAQVNGKFAHDTIFYQIAILNGAIDGSSVNTYSDTNSGKDGAARIVFTPFAHSDNPLLNDLNVGIAGTYGKELGSTAGGTSSGLPSFKTTGQLTFFTYNTAAYAKGEHFRYSPQLYWSSGSFGTLDELVISKQRVALGNEDSYVTSGAYQLEASYVLTGEKASYNGVNPNSPVGKGGGWGAFEAVVRFNHLQVDSQAFSNAGTVTTGYADPTKSAREANALGLGINWWLNHNIKVQLDYENTQFKNGAGTENATGHVTSLANRNTENLIVSEFQLLF